MILNQGCTAGKLIEFYKKMHMLGAHSRGKVQLVIGQPRCHLLESPIGDSPRHSYLKTMELNDPSDLFQLHQPRCSGARVQRTILSVNLKMFY